MSRVINPETDGKERNRLARSVLSAVRQLGRQEEVNDQTRDLAAYIALALETIHATIDATVEAWEKRGYWVKADRYRMEWLWAEQYGNKMSQAVLGEDWGSVALLAAEIGGRLNKYKELRVKTGAEPWQGAWDHLKSKATT
ncbi:MAG: hypothetical protein ACWGO1_14610 [Anaerolineales bacterium]